MIDAERYYVGVDVGTGSARAALVDRTGRVLSRAEHPIQTWNPQPDFYQQSSDDIWAACCTVVKKVTSTVEVTQVRGVGFDATCSLVLLDTEGKPLTVSKSGENEQNIVLWMDHRATEQAERINTTHHAVLKYVGGAISPEMAPPKLLWLKENLGEACWEKAGHMFELPDYLTWRATGSASRSLCSLICKWTYSASDEWSDSFWQEIGLADLVSDNYAKIGCAVQSPGERVGKGLTKSAAVELGLAEGTAVGTSLIDAHAGGLGMVGADVKGHNLPCENQPITARLSLICGTSSCHMALSKDAIFVPGVWGPYFSAMVPGLWLNEGGQSATGKVIDHVIETHAAFPELKEKAKSSGKSVSEYLNTYLSGLASDRHLSSPATLVGSLHVWPDYHGNRSPLGDPSLTGMICGLRLSAGLQDLALLYLATVQALAYGTRHILEALQGAGHDISTLFMCGGLSKNPLFVQTHADVTGLPVVLPKEPESVLVGAAILGAYASGDFLTIQSAMGCMARVGSVLQPSLQDRRYHDKKYAVFLKMVENQREYASIMCST
ncbi:PREDICTED: FGGY carbohydrate kinase domain-containing protein-like isoform X1 [Branchiostoma belcheri]|uniref:FGGY carbohydrate kinase domain-containing protein n=1 Tax=Branchiostoma belcheri TaxID=7741 RepID=A0A6P5AUI1_BRABE|nr:PREDICTED: FGGY carbohydrate kinase domain-containing protein-like isoform X1 [Branchiostoma belcheri]